MNYLKSIIFIGGLICLNAFPNFLFAQSGGSFEIEQSVIASGGGQQSAGGAFSLDGTIGQPVAGNAMSGSSFAVTSGFWNFTPLVPTASSAFISGRIKDEAGKGVRNVNLTLMNAATGELFYASSGISGFYKFENIPTGQEYILTVSARRTVFNPNTLFISLLGDLAGTDFIGTSGF